MPVAAGGPPPRRYGAVFVAAGLVVAAGVVGLPGATGGSAAAESTGPAPGELSYLVNTAATPAGTTAAERAVKGAGGRVVYAYPQTGTLVAASSAPGFAEKVRSAPGIDSAGATRTRPLGAAGASAPVYVGSSAGPASFWPRAGRHGALAESGASVESAGSAASAGEPLQDQQWDLRAVKADQAHEVSTGSRKVTVGIVDTGVDDTHEDLSANFDTKSSVSCVGGHPDRSAGAWRPTAGQAGSHHGTHVAGIVAAADNGKGIVGVAPGVRVASVKVSEGPESLFYGEAVVCALIWSAERGFAVANHSYYTDPWYFNCAGDPDQKAILEAVRRAAAYAERKGVLSVAAAGNEAMDLAHVTEDTASPNDGEPVRRPVDGSCVDLPSGLPDVLTVAATGAAGRRSAYSNYGLGRIDLAAPGGDAGGLQPPPAPATGGQIMSTLPGGRYGYLNGTSMAAPHVAGVAALAKSADPSATPAQLRRALLGGADPIACPGPENGTGPVCEGEAGDNGFYGRGLVDALDAVRAAKVG